MGGIQGALGERGGRDDEADGKESGERKLVDFIPII